MATVTEENETRTVTLTAQDADAKRAALADAGYGDETPRRSQLTFDVGGSEPGLASVKASVDLRIGRELRKGSEVRIAVMTKVGELLTESLGKIVAVTFEDQFDKDGFLIATERIHKVKL